jgi:DNA mismatch endonuclease (patch repair protein)
MERILKKTLKGGKFNNVSQVRSKAMGAVRGKGNKTTEMKFRLALVRAGIEGWKVHPKGIHGNPDVFFPSHQIAVFLDGCFWHGCDMCGHVPKSNRSYWSLKLQRNKERDKSKALILKKSGFRVIRFWEHELSENMRKCIAKTSALLLSKKTGTSKSL